MYITIVLFFIFFFKQKTAYELRISDWSSDVCSSDLLAAGRNYSSGAHREHRYDEAMRTFLLATATAAVALAATPAAAADLAVSNAWVRLPAVAGRQIGRAHV